MQQGSGSDLPKLVTGAMTANCEIDLEKKEPLAEEMRAVQEGLSADELAPIRSALPRYD
jgi:hypothetical protein